MDSLLYNLSKLALDGFNNVPYGLNPDDADNKMISLALCLQKNEDQPITLITKDINFRVKCDVLKIPSEDYYKDHIKTEGEYEFFTGVNTFEIDKSLIDDFYNGDLFTKDVADALCPNQFVVLKSNECNASAIAAVRDDKLVEINPQLNNMMKVTPRNKEQKFALDLLTNDKIKLVSITGIAGSGKTFLTLMSALSGIYNEQYSRIVITRSMQPVGKDIGFLPGSLEEKMSPWMSPIADNFRCNFKDLTYFEMMCQKRQIEVAPLTFMRGRTFNDAFIIVDEAQNATIHELKTIITRVGDNSKVVLLGDVEQIDTPYIDKLSNGLAIVAEKFKESAITGHIKLEKGERSQLATLASKVL